MNNYVLAPKRRHESQFGLPYPVSGFKKTRKEKIFLAVVFVAVMFLVLIGWVVVFAAAVSNNATLKS